MAKKKNKEKMKIINVVGARPNFMKIAPIMKQMGCHPEDMGAILLHTGQHYDEAMSKVFFKDLGIPMPDIDLNIGSYSHAVQTAKIMTAFEKVLIKERPDLVLVVGDVNSTLACSITSAKLCIPVAHVEAGLRSFDRTMPEEINRIVTDSISDYLFTTCEDANKNLSNEGIPDKNIFFVGNVMIDSLLHHRKKAKRSKILERLGLKQDYALLTLHRPSNVDVRETFKNIVSALHRISKDIQILFPAHPRTQKQIKIFGLSDYFTEFMNNDPRITNNGILLLDPLPYLDFFHLMANAKFVLTDSGGIQEETTILGVPCITLRENTERPVTITEGTNVLAGTNTQRIIDEALRALTRKEMHPKIPEYWDGKASERIVEILLDKLRSCH